MFSKFSKLCENIKSRVRMSDGSGDGKISFNCPCCNLDFEDNHIFQCQDGHLMCQKCLNSTEGKNCTTCNKALPPGTGIRNIALEHIKCSTTLLDLCGANTDKMRVATGTGGGKPNIETHWGETCHGSLCMGDEDPVRGTLFKCITCPQFNLCEMCIKVGDHAHHPFIRIMDQKMGHTVTQILKKSRSDSD